MTIRHYLLAPLLLLLVACGGADKYPYPPEFVSIDDVGIRALPAPPLKYSAEYNAEIDSILVRQSHLTDAQKTVIWNENHIAPDMIVTPVLGPHYTAARYPALFTLLKHAASDAWRTSDAMENYWNSPRPWYADSRVELLVPAIRQPGYPSGHTTTNGVWAHILSDLFPAKRDALFARAMEIGSHRVDAGAHFPHDVEGGRELADVLYEKMEANPEFQRELAAAKAELKFPPKLTPIPHAAVRGCAVLQQGEPIRRCHRETVPQLAQ